MHYMFADPFTNPSFLVLPLFIVEVPALSKAASRRMPRPHQVILLLLDMFATAVEKKVIGFSCVLLTLILTTMVVHESSVPLVSLGHS
jgi:hypothetical protein